MPIHTTASCELIAQALFEWVGRAAAGLLEPVAADNNHERVPRPLVNKISAAARDLYYSVSTRFMLSQKQPEASTKHLPEASGSMSYQPTNSGSRQIRESPSHVPALHCARSARRLLFLPCSMPLLSCTLSSLSTLTVAARTAASPCRAPKPRASTLNEQNPKRGYTENSQ